MLDIVEQPPAHCCSAMAASDDGRLLATTFGDRVTLWDLQTGLQLRQFIPPRYRVVADRPNDPQAGDYAGLAFDPSGRYPASTAVDFTNLHTLGRPWRLAVPNVWDINSGADLSATGWQHNAAREGIASPGFQWDPVEPALWQITKDSRVLEQLTGYRGQIQVFSPDGRTGIIVWGLDAGSEEVRAVDVETNHVLWTTRTAERWARRIAVSPDGRWVVLSGWIAPRVFDVRSGAEVTPRLTSEKNIEDVAFSRESKHLAIIDGRSAVVFTVGDWQRTGPFVAEDTNRLNVVAFTADGTGVFAGGDEEIVLWEHSSGRELRRISLAGARRVHALALSPTGRSLGAGTGMDNSFSRLRDGFGTNTEFRYSRSPSARMAAALALRAWARRSGIGTPVR